MALRNRPILMNNVNKENVINTKSSITTKTTITKRAVFGELGNRVNTQRGVEPIDRTSLLLKEKKQTASKQNDDRLAEKVLDIIKEKPAKVQEKPRVQLSKPILKVQGPVETNLVETKPLAPTIPTTKETESFSSDLITFEDIDEDDKGNPILVSTYCNDIYEHLRNLEKKFPINKNYLTGQEVTPKMRSVLIDWLIEVHQQFRLMQETLYLTVAIIDRFLQSFQTIDRKRLQLVGVTAMFIASKYEEMYSPDVSDFAYITDHAYTKLEILQMELLIIRTLDYSFGRPLPLHFLRRYSKAGKALPIHHTMAKYFLEQSLIHYEMCHYPPSLIAAAAIYLAFIILDNNEEGSENSSVWTKTLEHYSTYTKEDVLPIAKKIAFIITNADKSKYQAVRKKYVNAKFMKISIRPELKAPTIIAMGIEGKQT
ncbi:hypothetical protein KPH14_001158 [Odynerus spinipes]|uniref:G2/mitotic-specific cyclin-B n=1 Tax=Odynerus spinipes TaxID=1348599 RepID=A0AAD9RQ89_9HYME|nr:hypothetical protein KPH14_001158 [Odynerus spinipes]